MGDPAGVGPEVTLRAIAKPALRRMIAPILVGSTDLYTETAARLGLSMRFETWAPGDTLPHGRVPVCEAGPLRARDRIPAKPTVAGGRAAYAAILAAAELVRNNSADALVTAPISKANLAAAGCAATGHTEVLAELAGADVRMMMIGPKLRVALVTTHLAVAKLSAALDRQHIAKTIRIAATALRQHFGIETPHIAVSGLNPHAGERGLYGREEIDTITPAIRLARRSGLRITGPIAADSAFPLALRGAFDLVVCMYHDQGLGPFKILHFSDGVNFTAGLPFIRTSPDHGTAYDIAGSGVADPTSMIAAIHMAGKCAGQQEQ